MNVYLAKLTIYCGEYEKTNIALVQASSHSIASDYAIYIESHDPKNLDWSEDPVEDMFGEFAYRCSYTETVCSSEVAVLSKHLPIFTSDISELLQSGNYLKYLCRKPLGVTSDTEFVMKLAAKFDECRESACSEGHHTDTLFSQAVTAKIDAVLSKLSEEERKLASVLLESERWEYYHDTHNYDEAPFNEYGYCKHGLTNETCPCGCGEY